LNDFFFFVSFFQKIKKTQDPANPKYKGPVDVMGKVWREGGIRSLYKGTG